MKAKLVYWHKARLKNRYILEMKIHKISRSKKYPKGMKYGLILVDQGSGKRVLMDNHYPKGPHIHVNKTELSYHFINEGQ